MWNRVEGYLKLSVIGIAGAPESSNSVQSSKTFSNCVFVDLPLKNPNFPLVSSLYSALHAVQYFHESNPLEFYMYYTWD